MSIGIDVDNIFTYREYPSPQATGWSSRLQEMLKERTQIGIEPTTKREITDELRDFPLSAAPLIEQLRMIKSPSEIAMIQRAAHYADFGVERLLAASYYGAMVAEGFAETRTVSAKIIREVDDWDALTTKVLMATWAAPRSAMPHSVPTLQDQLTVGLHVALVLARVNGYSAESERTYFTASPSTQAKAAFKAMMESRRLAFGMIKPGVCCSDRNKPLRVRCGPAGFLEPRQQHLGGGLPLGDELVIIQPDDRDGSQLSH